MIWAADWNDETGTLSNKRRFITCPADQGLPDGATLVEVDQSWATLQTDGANEKIPLVQVKRIVFRA